jgi:hypothetical protein
MFHEAARHKARVLQTDVDVEGMRLSSWSIAVWYNVVVVEVFMREVDRVRVPTVRLRYLKKNLIL